MAFNRTKLYWHIQSTRKHFTEEKNVYKTTAKRFGAIIKIQLNRYARSKSKLDSSFRSFRLHAFTDLFMVVMFN